MKKKIFGLLGLTGIAVTCVALTGCSKGDRIEKTNVYMQSITDDVMVAGTNEVLFKANSDIPYIFLDEGVELMSTVRAINLDNTKYRYSLAKENNNYVITNEKGAKCTISTDDQTLKFDDYDKFVATVQETQEPLSTLTIKSGYKPLKQVSSSYVKGNEVTMDLKPYSKLDIYVKDNKCYLPISVFNSALYNTSVGISLGYNGKNLFIIHSKSLSEKQLDGSVAPSELGKKFREGAEKSSISADYAEYYYQSLCFDFDYMYGLKEKFTKFDDFLKNYKNDLVSTDPKKIDNTTLAALTWLNDGHTALAEYSNMYKFGEYLTDRDKINPETQKLETADSAFENVTKALVAAGKITRGLEYKGDTVFVTFTEFTDIVPNLLYNESITDNDSLDDFPDLDFKSTLTENDLLKRANTACLFNQLYKDLTTTTYKDSVKNIVVDLTSNGGGSVDGLLYGLSTLIGNVKVDMSNPLSGAHNSQEYAADINADGNIDANDKSLSDLGFNIYFLDSRYSFSSANAMPYLAKLNKPSVILLGDKTGGGPCALRYSVTPLGSALFSSSLTTLSKKVDGKYVNIDDGIAADYKLTEEQMLDRSYIVSNINKWTSK